MDYTMFKFLKDKLKGAISKFSKSVEEEAKVEEPIKEEKVLEEEKEIIKEEEKLGVEKPKESPIEQEVEEEVKEEEEKKLEKERIEKEKELEKVEQPEKKGFFSKLKEKIITTKISYEKFENLFSGLERLLFILKELKILLKK